MVHRSKRQPDRSIVTQRHIQRRVQPQSWQRSESHYDRSRWQRLVLRMGSEPNWSLHTIRQDRRSGRSDGRLGPLWDYIGPRWQCLVRRNEGKQGGADQPQKTVTSVVGRPTIPTWDCPSAAVRLHPGIEAEHVAEALE